MLNFCYTINRSNLPVIISCCIYDTLSFNVIH